MEGTRSKYLRFLRNYLVEVREAYEFMRDGFDQGLFPVETEAEKNRARDIYALCFDDIEEAIELLDKAE
jgi:hypothetical protein